MTRPPRRAQTRWIDCDDGFIGAAWFWPTKQMAASTAVVIVPGIAHEERTMAGGLVALAESLADAGLPALLMDLHGCSQSAGGLDDADIGDRWRNGIRAALDHARGTGASRVIVVGIRLGFPLAAEALADKVVDGLVAWSPIVSGRRHVRELRLLQRANDAEAQAAGAVEIGGFSIPAAVLERISELELSKARFRTARFMLCDMPEGLDAPWFTQLREIGLHAQTLASRQIYEWLFGGSDHPSLPLEDVEALVGWCRNLHDEEAAPGEQAPVAPAPRPAIEFDHQGRLLRETFVEIGPLGLTGVLSEPVRASEDHAVRLMVSTVGPGRSFVDFARDEAARGNTSLRFDFAGFGTSGRGDAVQGGELYTDQGARDVRHAVEYLRRTGRSEIYGLGFCAGAWSMMQSDITDDLRAAVAINVALYRKPGPAVAEVAKRTRHRMTRFVPALVRSPLMRRIVARVRRPDGERFEPVDWLVRMCGADVRVLLAFAEQDKGLNYFNGQMSRGVREQLQSSFHLRTYAELGHLAEGPTARIRMFKDIAAFFADTDREVQKRAGERPRLRRAPNRANSAP